MNATADSSIVPSTHSTGSSASGSSPAIALNSWASLQLDEGVMAARSLSTPQPDHKKTNPTGTAERPVKQKLFEMIRAVSQTPTHREPLHSVVKKRWLKSGAIVGACSLLLIILLPLFINVNSFSGSTLLLPRGSS